MARAGRLAARHRQDKHPQRLALVHEALRRAAARAPEPRARRRQPARAWARRPPEGSDKGRLARARYSRGLDSREGAARPRDGIARQNLSAVPVREAQRLWVVRAY